MVFLYPLMKKIVKFRFNETSISLCRSTAEMNKRFEIVFLEEVLLFLKNLEFQALRKNNLQYS